METVKIDKVELARVLEENRAQHRAEFEEALEGYKKVATQQLEEQVERIRAGKIFQVQVVLPLPQDHTEDYDRVIRQCEMSVEAELVLTDHEFQCYVMDDWSWKKQFTATNSAYSNLSVP